MSDVSNSSFAEQFLRLSCKNFVNQQEVIEKLIKFINFSTEVESQISNKAVKLSEVVRSGEKTLIEDLLASYDLTQDEGMSLLCLTEAILRIKDSATVKLLLEDKLKDKHWLNKIENSSFFMKLTAIGLTIASKTVNFSGKGGFSRIISNLSAPIIQTVMKNVIKYISDDFIIGKNVEQALKRSEKFSKSGYLLSYDILGESSRSAAQSEFYYKEYVKTIKKMAKARKANEDIFAQNNLSIKLSSLHPRVELLKFEVLKEELYPKVKELVVLCAKHQICIMFDAEESFRADTYLMILQLLLADEDLKNFNGIGVVLQSYHKRTFYVIETLIEIAKAFRKKIPVRLVKGAYWDFEIKRSQMLGLKDYPVFTHKKFTDVSYIATAKKLIESIEYFYPQFATHSAHTVAAVMYLVKDKPKESFEFQKLLGMGDSLYNSIVAQYRVRIYAPLGQYKDLLAYLMRRFIENGANSSFVNQVFKTKSLKILNESPITKSIKGCEQDKFTIPSPSNIFKDRINSEGFELGYLCEVETLKAELSKVQGKTFNAQNIIAGKACKEDGNTFEIHSPIDSNTIVGTGSNCSEKNLENSIKCALEGFAKWSKIHFTERKKTLLKAASLYEEHKFVFYHLLINEAGKSIEDAISEVREAIDFIRYYAHQAAKLFGNNIPQQGYTGEHNMLTYHPKGVFLCISPWNFPLAIFTGQVVAALATGNSVISKPASSTCAIATYAIKLLHKAGVITDALNLVIASGKDISQKIITSENIAGVCVTGATETAWHINRTLAARNSAIASLIAETGGQNCMIVDSSSLLEQVVDDVVRSAFISQGQRCSALRVLYVQDEIYNEFSELLHGALEQLTIGDTNIFSNDLGPVIDKNALERLEDHVKAFKSKVVTRHKGIGKQKKLGYYFKPTIIEIKNILELDGEKFGAVLHLRRYKAKDLEAIITEINSTKFGLTFGIHSRIKGRNTKVANKICAGNIYINRNMIGAIVESQPFGGEGLSGTGFKAGGPNYLLKFLNERTVSENITAIGGNVELLCYD